MLRFGRKGAQVLGAALMAASGVGLLNVATATAHADPAYSYGASNASQGIVVVGSDTIQDLMDGFMGANNNKTYAGLIDVNNFQIASFDAVEPGTGVNGAQPVYGCIITKLNMPTIDRPNGSGSGLQAYSDALQGKSWPNNTDTTANGPSNGVQGITGQPATCNQNGGAAGGVPLPGSVIDVSRSSSGPGNVNTGDQLRFVPFARGALGVVCYDATTHAGTANDACNVTTAELQSAYTGGGTFTDAAGDTVGVCTPQPGSGTYKSWATDMDPSASASAAQAAETAAGVASGCNAGTPNYLIEEHNGNAFLVRVQALISGGSGIKAWVYPMDFSQWTAQADGANVDRSANLRALSPFSGSPAGGQATIDGVAPTTGSAPNITINTNFYEGVGTTINYGRDMYIVVSTPALTGTSKSGGNVDLQNMFGSTPTSPLNQEPGGVAVICQAAAQNLIHQFGFDTTLQAGHTCGVGLPSSYY